MDLHWATGILFSTVESVHSCDTGCNSAPVGGRETPFRGSTLTRLWEYRTKFEPQRDPNPSSGIDGNVFAYESSSKTRLLLARSPWILLLVIRKTAYALLAVTLIMLVSNGQRKAPLYAGDGASQVLCRGDVIVPPVLARP